MTMPQDILNPTFWQKRLYGAEQLHHAVFRCSADKWQHIEQRHQELLAQHVKPTDSVLDAGCAWGRVVSLLPSNWQGVYTGIALFPEFIDLARRWHSDHTFHVGDLRDNLHYLTEPLSQPRYDWAVAISMRPMIIRNLGEEGWELIQQRLCSVASRVLLLEYKEDDTGEVLTCTKPPTT